MKRNLFQIIASIIRRIMTAYELRRYDRYSIAEYLRKKGSQIGDNCSIIPTDLGTEPYLVKIGNRVAIAAGVKFMTHEGGARIFKGEIPDIQLFGPIVIEDNCMIGEGAVLCPNITIGKNSIVGANSVVIMDVPPETIVMGVPARPLGSVAKFREKCVEGWKVQRPPDCIIESGEDWWYTKHFADNREKLKRHLLKVFSGELGRS